MAYRTIDAQGIWKGESAAIDTFAKAFAFDCGGDAETWHKIYGWTPEALNQALDKAFPCRDNCGMGGIER